MRKELLSIAIEEKNRDLLSSRNKWFDEKNKVKSTHTVAIQKELAKRLEQKSSTTAEHLNKKMNKKVSFYLQERSDVSFAKKKKVRMKTLKQSNERKKKNRQNYKRNKESKKEEKMNEMVDRIKTENVVINLSEEEIPAPTFISQKA